MSSASMAETPDLFNGETVAFVQMHGAVRPTKLVTVQSEETPGCCQYELTGNPLPQKTELCAPKIVGKSYHATDTSKFISTLRAEWDKHPLPRPSFPEFCLSELKSFEQTQRGLMEQEMEASYFIQMMEGGYTEERMKRRLVLQGAIVAKMDIKWEDKHECSIAQKSYHVIAKDRIQNCIMFFCNCREPEPGGTLRRLTVSTPSAGKISVRVSYNSETKLFKITFDQTTNYEFSFEDLNNIIRIVVSGFTGDLDFNLTLFDFTCCVALFQDECSRGLTPQLLSSTMLSNSDVDSIPKLIYGTIREDRQRELESQVKIVTPAHISGNIDDDDDLSSQKRIPESQLPFLSPSHSPYPYPSHSPSPTRPTASLVVHLIEGVESFADFEPISRFELRRTGNGNSSRSVSPHSSGRGGGRSRLIKKVSRKRITRRQRHTNRRLRAKGSTRRTKLKRKPMAE